MKILALEREVPGASAEEMESHLVAEAEQVWKLYRAGVVRDVCFDADKHTAVLMLECTDVREAEGALQTLPLVQSGLIRFDVIPLSPYDGFSRLFA